MEDKLMSIELFHQILRSKKKTTIEVALQLLKDPTDKKLYDIPNDNKFP